MKSLSHWLIVSATIHIVIVLSLSNLGYFHQDKAPLMVDLTIVPAPVTPVEEAVSRWRFKPAIFQEKPVKCRVTQGFEFGLYNLH